MHTGEYLSPVLGVIRPTGKPVSWTRVAVRRIIDRKFARGFYGVALRQEGAELALLEHLVHGGAPALRGGRWQVIA